MKKEFPFLAAFLLALLLHAVAGMGLKYSRLFAAVPISPAGPEPPVTLKFVEVPPNAATIPQPLPNAQHFSDANRKAGPLHPNGPERPVVSQPAMRPPGAPGRPAVPGQQQRASMAPPSSSPRASQQIEQPPAIGPGEPRIVSGGQQLSDSLTNLDHYIQGSPGSGNGGGDADGGEPTGDPGSGVFFDTQGYDLGPWANRAVEIVRSNWIIPVAADLGMKGVVGISFKIDRSGKVLDLKVISPSGIPSFDQAALSALQSSSPLPPLPADFPRPLLPGIFRFYYNTPVPKS